MVENPVGGGRIDDMYQPSLLFLGGAGVSPLNALCDTTTPVVADAETRRPSRGKTLGDKSSVGGVTDTIDKTFIPVRQGRQERASQVCKS